MADNPFDFSPSTDLVEVKDRVIDIPAPTMQLHIPAPDMSAVTDAMREMQQVLSGLKSTLVMISHPVINFESPNIPPPDLSELTRVIEGLSAGNVEPQKIADAVKTAVSEALKTQPKATQESKDLAGALKGIQKSMETLDFRIKGTQFQASGGGPSITPVVDAINAFKTGVSGVISSVAGYQNVIPIGTYSATPPTLTDGQFATPQLDAAGNQKVTLQSLVAGENLTYNRLMMLNSFSATNITTNATTVVKSGPGFLHTITFNNPGAITVASLTCTVYDNTAGSGTKIGTITVPVATSNPFTVTFNIATTTGLTVVTAGPTVTADITVGWL